MAKRLVNPALDVYQRLGADGAVMILLLGFPSGAVESDARAEPGHEALEKCRELAPQNLYPLPAVGGPSYLEIVRGPLWDVDMLAAGGFGVDEIPAYRAAGARAFGLAAPLLIGTEGSPKENIAHALTLARGDR